MPPFERYRRDYLSDESFRQLQQSMLNNPEAGDLIEGTGGLRKHAPCRCKARQRQAWRQFWLFTLYDKDEMEDLDAEQKKMLKAMLKCELEARREK